MNKTKISKIGRRGKIVLATLIALMFIGIASAGLLDHYNTITVNATVKQSIVVDGKDITEPISDDLPNAVGGGTYCFAHYIKNRAPIDGTVSFSLPTVNGHGAGPDGVTVTYKDSVHLENKNPADWSIISGDNIEADVTFGLVGEEFAYTLEATGLTSGTEYALIYYADYEDRENNWGGNNPGAILGIFTADSDGAISYSYSLDIGMDMPHVDDWNNAPPADYTVAPDNYNHETGAKIWLVPTSDLTNNNALPLTAWNPDDYLFETELIRYFDNANNEITIPAGEFIDFVICYEFAIDIVPGTYTITTTVSPIV